MASILNNDNIFKLSNNIKDIYNENKLKNIKEILNEMKLNLDFFFYKSTLISNLPSITKNGIILYHLYIYINITFKKELRKFINTYIENKYEIIKLYKSIRNENIKYHKLRNRPNVINALNLRFDSIKNGLYDNLENQKIDIKRNIERYFKILIKNKSNFYDEEEISFTDGDDNDIDLKYKRGTLGGPYLDLNIRKTKIIKQENKEALNAIKYITDITENLKKAIENIEKMEEVYRIFANYTTINIRLDAPTFKINHYNIRTTEAYKKIDEKIKGIEENIRNFNIKIKNSLEKYISNILQFYNISYKDSFKKIINDIFLLDIKSIEYSKKTIITKITKSTDNKYVELFKKDINIETSIPYELKLIKYDNKLKENILLQGPNDIIKYKKNLIYISFNKIFNKLKFKILDYNYDIENIIEYFKILNIFYSESEYNYDIKNYYNILFVLITNILLTFNEIINILLYYLDTNIDSQFKIKYKFGPIYIINNDYSEKDYINNDEFLQCDKDNSHNYEKDDYVNYDTDVEITIKEPIEDSKEDINEYDYIFNNKDINKIFNDLLCIFIIPRLILINSIYKKENIKIRLYYFSHFKC